MLHSHAQPSPRKLKESPAHSLGHYVPVVVCCFFCFFVIPRHELRNAVTALEHSVGFKLPKQIVFFPLNHFLERCDLLTVLERQMEGRWRRYRAD